MLLVGGQEINVHRPGASPCNAQVGEDEGGVNDFLTNSETPTLRFLAQESLVIREKLKSSSRQIRFWSAPATIENLRSRLDHGCQVLHYAGRGLPDCLKFEDTTRCGVARSLQVHSCI